MGTGDRLSRRVLLAYAAPAFALAMPTIPLYIYLPSFYADTLGLGLVATGAVMLAARIFDVVTDPLIGLASDHVRLRWGRRKPWIVLGALIAAVALVRLFQPPDVVTPTYLLLWAVLAFVGWTLISIPYTAWGAELSEDYHERARITGAREAATILGIVAAGALPAIAVASGVQERFGLALVGWLAIGVGLPTLGLLIWRVPERHREATTSPPVWSWSVYRALFDNRPFIRLLSAWFVNGLANGLPSVLFPLYLQYGLEAGPIARTVLILVYFVAGIAAIPAWVALSRRYSKHRVWCWAMLLACGAFVWVPMLGAGDVAAFFVVCVVTGLGLGADLALPPAMQADVIDYDTMRTRQRRAGLFFALWSMATKMALGFAVGIAFPAVAFFGFAPGPGNAPSAILALAVIYALVPCVLKLVAVAIVWNHPITERRQDTIRRNLARLSRRTADAPS
jgi:Na+/melibiose symporter-like transporter